MRIDNKKRKYILLLCIGLAIIILVIWTVWGNKALMVSEISISSDRLPTPFSGFRIAQVSDLHNAELGEDNANLLKMLSECQPDIVVITGDLIDIQHTDIEIALDFAEESVKIAPTYFVTGNHEAGCSQYDTLKTELESVGVIVLEDEIVYLERNGETIALLGLDDPNFTIKGDMFGEVPAMVSTKIKNMIDPGTAYSVLLSHRPELFETYVASGIDLVFSGHAHGGQFRLPFIGGLIAPNQGLFPKYDAGLFTDGHTNMIVSRGLGNSIIPIRFNNRPEIILVELNTNEDATWDFSEIHGSEEGFIVSAQNLYNEGGWGWFPCSKSGTYHFQVMGAKEDIYSPATDNLVWKVYLMEEPFIDTPRFIPQAGYEAVVIGDGSVEIEEGTYIVIYCSQNSYEYGLSSSYEGDSEAFYQCTME